jgi:hypothetical protein
MGLVATERGTWITRIRVLARQPDDRLWHCAVEWQEAELERADHPPQLLDMSLQMLYSTALEAGVDTSNVVLEAFRWWCSFEGLEDGPAGDT